MRLESIKAEVEDAGLAHRGAFHPGPDDLPHGLDAGTIVMLGFVGGEQWAGFAASPEYKDGKPHPLDRWSHRVISALARELGAKPCFPFTTPLMPFIRWAQKAEPVAPSEIGMLIHPEYGLWHAWRGALAIAEKLELPPSDRRPRPCESCVEKPCLTACPVGAFSGGGAYDVPACGAHIRRPEGADCMSMGCRARRACPVGKEYQYTPDQAAFHMRSFRGG
ncbi:hypothetical protein [Hyphococcus sp.]|uniref:hypothetical protein n=1 Tax=Hyphococcus sp. TaxID=2038636 RepID=UPI003CCBD686